MDLNDEHFRVMIFYDFKAGLNATESHKRLGDAFVGMCPSYSMVKK